MGDLERYLQVLVGAEPEGRFLELRYRRAAGMGQRFLPAVDVDAAARIARRLGASSDTYVGVALRDRPLGGRSAVTDSRVVFVEVDAEASSRLLQRTPQPPSMTVKSGTPGHLHAYWLLSRSVSAAEVKAANRKLCHRVGGDLASVDEARILRPPQTLNFKHQPPRAVVLQSLDTDRVYELRDLIRGLDDPPGHQPEVRPRAVAAVHHRSAPEADGVHAVLRAIPTAEYVQRLTGLEPNREGKVSCPWHEDRTPSLHCYPEGEWCCFGCRRGGTIYDFAGAVWGIETKGRAFVELRARLADEFGISPPPARRSAARKRQRRPPSGAMAAVDRERLMASPAVSEKGGR
jgi:RepB DNA-primase from phage plasmid/CHC2 zinc finger